MKKSTKIILPALAVLVLGTAAAATGTVAWFAANGKVVAKGMVVECDTSKNLMITNDNTFSKTGKEFGTEATSLHAPIKQLVPVSTTSRSIKAHDDKFVKSDSSVNVTTGMLTEGAVLSEATDAAGDYAKHSFWVAASSPEDMLLSIKSIAVSELDEEGNVTAASATLNSYISQALRFAVYYVDGTDSNEATKVHSQIFRLGAGTETYYGIDTVGTVGTVTYSGSKVTEVDDEDGEEMGETVTPKAQTEIAGFSLGKLLATKTGQSIENHTWSQVDFYFWYEGQDTACTAANALSVQRLSFNITLEASEAPKA